LPIFPGHVQPWGYVRVFSPPHPSCWQGSQAALEDHGQCAVRWQSFLDNYIHPLLRCAKNLRHVLKRKNAILRQKLTTCEGAVSIGGVQSRQGDGSAARLGPGAMHGWAGAAWEDPLLPTPRSFGPRSCIIFQVATLERWLLMQSMPPKPPRPSF